MCIYLDKTQMQKKKKACNSYKGKNEIKDKQRTIDNICVSRSPILK